MTSDENTSSQEELARKNARLGRIVLGVVVAMIGLAYASVPLYDLFCRVTGWGGTTQVSDSLPTPEEIVDRIVTVRFDANTARDLPWVFKNETHDTNVKLGQRGFANFVAQNRSTKPTTGMALFNVTPLKAGKYFHKIQCFCFDEQTLQVGQRVDMPVMFYVDPKMHEDRNMDDVQTITLSYSFFRAESKGLDDALEAFGDDELVGQ